MGLTYSGVCLWIMTCKTFYFLKSVRLGLTTLQVCHVLGLYTIVKGLENYHFCKIMKIDPQGSR